MAYHHILVHREEQPTQHTLLFKDLSDEEVRTPFMVRFIRGAQRDAPSGDRTASSLRASVIRTGRPHDPEVSDYLRTWGQQAEEFMRISGYPVNSQPMGDSAIAGAGEDITAEFLESSAPGLETIEEARERFKRWQKNRIPLAELVRVLAL